MFVTSVLQPVPRVVQVPVDGGDKLREAIRTVEDAYAKDLRSDLRL